MKRMQIQVHRSSDDKSVFRLIGVLMRLATAKEINVQKGAAQKNYTNIAVLTPSVRKLWDALEQTVRRHKDLRQNTLVVCEGKHGWDDYELIYHWDPEQIDQKWR